MRALISYEDIADPEPEQGQPSSAHTVDHAPPPRKRRKNNRQEQRHRNQEGDEYRGPQKRPRRDYGIKEESRQLSHEEIWDDSALIHAWDAAIEEYKVLNGPEKKWKTEPINKSALWYNIPPEEEETSSSSGPSFLMPSIPAAFASRVDAQEQEAEPTDPENSQPINFQTFVPPHDPAQPHVHRTNGVQSHVPDSTDGLSYPSVIPPPPAGVMTKDEAFKQAIGAWYWAGYWTGIYHSAGSSNTPDAAHAGKEDELENVEVAVNGIEHSQDEDFVPDGNSVGEEQVEEPDLIPT